MTWYHLWFHRGVTAAVLGECENTPGAVIGRRPSQPTDPARAFGALLQAVFTAAASPPSSKTGSLWAGRAQLLLLIIALTE